MKDRQIFIDLGEVRDVSEVFVNGQSAGILWKKPYRAEHHRACKGRRE